VTSQQLAVDQAAIDTAQANLDAAKAALDDVNLVSTIAGTVASVSIAPAATVSAGGSSTSPAIVVIGSGSSYEVTTDVAVADIGEIAVGQQAQVTPDSTGSVVDGTVTSVGAVATSSGTSTTYPVTVSIDSPDLGGLSGSQANVSIVVKRSVDVTTVPSSAVTTVGTIHYVTVVDGNTAKAVRVTLGTVGDILTQVTSGVTRGEQVSLANLTEPVPSSSTATTTRRFGGGAGFGGDSFAGFGGGGSFAGTGSFAGGGPGG
jgi:HlyD family secretion protein